MDGDLRLWSWTESVEQKPLDPIDVYIFYPPNKWEKPNLLEVGPWTFDLAMVQIARILANRATNPQGSHVCFSVKSCHMENHRNLGNLNVKGDAKNLEKKHKNKFGTMELNTLSSKLLEIHLLGHIQTTQREVTRETSSWMLESFH